jgi:hypothetical protein
MVLYRKGKMIKIEKIEKHLAKFQPKTYMEAWNLLDAGRFNLNSREMNDICHNYITGLEILATHGKGILAEIPA